MKEYAVTVNGVETTMLLDDDDAKKYENAKPVSAKAAEPEVKAVKATANKARGANNK